MTSRSNTRTHVTTNRARWGAVAALGAMVPLVLTIAGCPITDGSGGGNGGDPRLLYFSSADELVNYFKNQAQSQNRSGGSRSLFDAFGVGAAPSAAEGGVGTNAADSAGGQSFSTTNLQEVGVDESDVLKSDGTNYYIAKGRSLRIVRADPVSAMAEIGRVDLEQPIQSLYLLNGKVLAITQSYGIYYGGPGIAIDLAIWPPYYGSSDLKVYEIDVANPAAPNVTRKLTLDGTIAESRLTNGRLILVTTFVPNVPETPLPLALTNVRLEDVLPMAKVGDDAELAVNWDRVLRPSEPGGYNMIAVITLDASNVESIVSSTAVMANAGTVYSSTEALYVTDTDYDASNNYREKTTIHKLAYGDDGAARYTASGSVPGRLLNQFALGEHNGFLRVATHVNNIELFTGGPIFSGFRTADATSQSSDGNVGSGDNVAPVEPPVTRPTQAYNAVYVLGASGDKLNTVGSIENIAPGETLYSSRFMGERGFLVTFRQIDPLFVLNLSDPTQPRIVGELKIPGYSDYLHPLGDTHLIGVGRSISRQFGFEEPDAVQLSLFDISDPTDPKVVQQISVGGPFSYSDVSATHKAFTFLADRGLLALPVQLNSPSDRYSYGGIEFDGVLCYRVEKTGFTALGRVGTVFNDAISYPYVSWRRGAFIGDMVYSVSPDGVRAAPLSDFAQTATVVLTPNPDDLENRPSAEDGSAGATDPAPAK